VRCAELIALLGQSRDLFGVGRTRGALRSKGGLELGYTRIKERFARGHRVRVYSQPRSSCRSWNDEIARRRFQ
jgi:hypothetical protein